MIVMRKFEYELDLETGVTTVRAVFGSPHAPGKTITVCVTEEEAAAILTLQREAAEAVREEIVPSHSYNDRLVSLKRAEPAGERPPSYGGTLHEENQAPRGGQVSEVSGYLDVGSFREEDEIGMAL